MLVLSLENGIVVSCPALVYDPTEPVLQLQLRKSYILVSHFGIGASSFFYIYYVVLCMQLDG